MHHRRQIHGVVNYYISRLFSHAQVMRLAAQRRAVFRIYTQVCCQAGPPQRPVDCLHFMGSKQSVFLKAIK